MRSARELGRCAGRGNRPRVAASPPGRADAEVAGAVARRTTCRRGSPDGMAVASPSLLPWCCHRAGARKRCTSPRLVSHIDSFAAASGSVRLAVVGPGRKPPAFALHVRARHTPVCPAPAARSSAQRRAATAPPLPPFPRRRRRPTRPHISA